MIINFSIENFRSISSKVTFSLETDSSRSKLDNVFSVTLEDSTKTELLKTAVIYGANGSGKSNFIKSFYALRWLITNSMDFRVGKSIECYEPFELDEEYLERPTSFEILY